MQTPIPSAFLLLKQTLSFYKKHIETLLFIGLIASLVASVSVLLDGLIEDGIAPEIVVLSTILSLLFALVSFVVSIIVPIVFIKTVDDLNEGKIVSVNEAYETGFKLFFPCLWVAILTSAVIMGASFLFIIPGIILSLFLAFPLYTFMLRGERGVNALASSFYLSKGYVWEIFKKYFFLGVVGAVLISVVFGIPTLVFILATGNETFFINLVGNSVFRSIMDLMPVAGTFVTNALLLPLFYIYFYFIYKHVLSVKPEAHPDVDYAKSRKWFAALVVIAVIGFIGFATWVIFGLPPFHLL